MSDQSSPATPDPAARLVNGRGEPARRHRRAEACPRCGAGPEQRTPSAGFGTPHDVCRLCGYEFLEKDDA